MLNCVDVEANVQITVFLGAPGSGKGTQAKKLSLKNQFVHLSTGDMLRAAIKNETALGQQAKSFMERGELVPDDLVIQLIKETLTQLDSSKHILLDGFPRTVRQAEALNSNPATQVQQAVLFEIPDDILIERLTGRRVCTQCGQPFHLKHMPPKLEGSCDKCGGQVVHRSDDQESVVRKRLEVFHSQNKGLVDFYSRHNSLRKLDANLPADKVEKLLFGILQ